MESMKVVSVNVGLPREALWKGKTAVTGIFKQPVEGRVRLGRLNLEGDRQADLTVHGGVAKAVYAYPAHHYPYWRDQLPEMQFPWGTFGENLTTDGLGEDAVNIGDEFRIGSALVRVTQPRIPCYKLALKFGRDDIIKRFLRSLRSGFYLSVVEEGDVAAGDSIEVVHREPDSLTVTDVVRLYTDEKQNASLLARAAEIPALPQGWRDYFRRRVEQMR